MDNIICGPSALSYYRTPPQVLALCPILPVSEDHATKTALPSHPTFRELFGETLHTLVFSNEERTNAKHIKQHLWTGPLPPAATIEDPVVGTVASPLLTLFTLAQYCTDIELAMIMHEFCGEFAVYRPSDKIEGMLPEDTGKRLAFGWERSPSSSREPSSLWMRPPLIEPHELDGFAEQVRGRRGSRRFERARSMLAGVTRSPLEVRAAMLLALPRTLGGRGIAIETNAVIRLTKDAAKIARRGYCVADILITSSDGTRVVDVECQGDGVHKGNEAIISDADRTTALGSMGVSVVLVSHAQIASRASFNVLVDYIASELGEHLPAQSDRMVASEEALRSELFQEWEALGDADGGGRAKKDAKPRARPAARGR